MYLDCIRIGCFLLLRLLMLVRCILCERRLVEEDAFIMLTCIYMRRIIAFWDSALCWMDGRADGAGAACLMGCWCANSHICGCIHHIMCTTYDRKLVYTHKNEQTLTRSIIWLHGKAHLRDMQFSGVRMLCIVLCSPVVWSAIVMANIMRWWCGQHVCDAKICGNVWFSHGPHIVIRC